VVDPERWAQAISDAETFLAVWGAQARLLGWTARELFGLHPVPERPAPTFRRLSRFVQDIPLGAVKSQATQLAQAVAQIKQTSPTAEQGESIAQKILDLIEQQFSAIMGDSIGLP
jgi:hypothetical protein